MKNNGLGGEKMDFSKDRKGTGTKEWSEFSFNIGIGCSNNCLYCYARANALRYKRISEPSEWKNEIVNEKAIGRAGVKHDGVIMFPTTHDITPTYLEPSIQTLKKMLAAGNQVLIVSKPRFECIKRLCEELAPYKEQILFRFTIGTLNNILLQIWEPGAPNAGHRIASLSLAKTEGFKTSVSMEPFLGDIDNVIETFNALEPFVTEKIWIGKMNKISARVKEDSPEIKDAIELIEEQQNNESIKWLYGRLKNHPKVAWKDSIKQVIKGT
jgi:DNA repair photolyase